MSTTTNISALGRRYPIAFERDEHEQFAPVPADFLRFLRQVGLASNAREIVLQLLMLLPFDPDPDDAGDTVAEISDDRLAERTGIDSQNLWRTLKDPRFLSVVVVERGERRERGKPPKATRYNLRRLFEAYRNWREMALG